MSTPAIIWIVLAALSMGYVISKHGQPRNENYSIWVNLFDNLIVAGLLYWGGFFGMAH